MSYQDSECVCKLLIVSDGESNSLRNLITLSFSSSVLQKAILALAARHLANAGQSFYQAEELVSSVPTPFAHDALLFKHYAIEELSRALDDPNELKKETTVACIFLLILLEVLESGHDGWKSHVEGAKRLITLHQPLKMTAGINQKPTQTLQDLRDFLAQQIHLYEYTVQCEFLRKTLI